MVYAKRKLLYNYLAIMLFLTTTILIYGFIISDDSEYVNCYWVNALYLLLVCVIYGNKYVSGKFDVYDPITSFTVLFLLMFFVAPMRSVVLKEYYAYGVDMFPYAIKGSTYAFIGYISFYVIYVFKQNSISTRCESICHISIVERNLPVSLFLIFGILATLIGTLLNTMRSSGNSILYILTFGVFGRGGIEEGASDLGFIGFLSFALPSFVLLYLEYGKSKRIAYIFLAITFSLKITSGFRWNIVQMVVMFGSYYFLRSRKKVRFKSILLAIILLTIPIFLMSMFRSSIRAGNGIDFSLINSDVFVNVLDDAFWSNLDIYKSYYSIISVVPSRTGFLFGKQMILYTMIILIPRAIWPGKPGNPGTVAQGLALGQAAVMGGFAYPCLGEYYYDSGLLGIIIYTGLFGYLTSTLQNRYRYKAKTEIDLMVFCTILSQIIQLVIRGYMPTNFWRLIVSVFPYWIFKRVYYVRS